MKWNYKQSVTRCHGLAGDGRAEHTLKPVVVTLPGDLPSPEITETTSPSLARVDDDHVLSMSAERAPARRMSRDFTRIIVSVRFMRITRIITSRGVDST